MISTPCPRVLCAYRSDTTGQCTWDPGTHKRGKRNVKKEVAMSVSVTVSAGGAPPGHKRPPDVLATETVTTDLEKVRNALSFMSHDGGRCPLFDRDDGRSEL